MCARTIYCTNIDKKVVLLTESFHGLLDSRFQYKHYLFVYMLQVTQADVKLFFESICGEVYNLTV